MDKNTKDNVLPFWEARAEYHKRHPDVEWERWTAKLKTTMAKNENSPLSLLFSDGLYVAEQELTKIRQSRRKPSPK